MTWPARPFFGVATAAYQIEGAVAEDGRGESIWDRFSHTPGAVAGGATGDVACDHYHRWREDLDLMAAHGVESYRFSIAWPRVQPTGRGAANDAGLRWYRELAEGLLERGIEPVATLYHWDLPQALQDDGGWAARDTTERFAEYAAIAAEALGDVVAAWITHNEPNVVAFLGHAEGVMAPGLRDWATALRVSHHLLLSHGRAVQILRELSPSSEVGITLNLDYAYAAGDDDGDEQAAAWVDGFHNRWFLDPIFKGAYPEDMVEAWRDLLPEIQDGDLETISVPIDFLGVNNYTSPLVAADTDGGRSRIVQRADVDRTDMGWEVVPEGLRDLLLRLARDYAPKGIYVTENGAAYPDVRGHDGSVGDPERQSYFEGYIGAAAEAAASGVPLKGYFAWSLLDNFEWAWGYWKRFGLVYVDFATLERVPKGSFYWYRDLIAAQRAQGEDTDDAYAVA